MLLSRGHTHWMVPQAVRSGPERYPVAVLFSGAQYLYHGSICVHPVWAEKRVILEELERRSHGVKELRGRERNDE
jgi:hypothetical protein